MQVPNAVKSQNGIYGAIICAAFAVVVFLALANIDWLGTSFRFPLMNAFSEASWVKALTATEERALKPLDSFRECSVCPVMVVIPTGEFAMGSPETEKYRISDEGPQHKVTLKRAFAVSKFSVTFDQWDACFNVGGCKVKANDFGWGRKTRPAIDVSWQDAHEYMAWLSKHTGKPYRLLSEAEWEYTARAGTTTAFYWGDDIGKGHANCNGCGDQWGAKQTAPVGSFPANSYGIYDILGNVFEWVEDCYHSSYDGAPTDGSAWTNDKCNERVARGGSFSFDAGDLRSASRLRYIPAKREIIFGIRAGRTLLSQ